MAEQRRLSSSNSSHSQISESLQTVEESLLVGEKSSPVVLGRQESVFLAESSASTTGNPGSVIVPQYGSSKITVFVWGKNIILKFLGNTK